MPLWKLDNAVHAGKIIKSHSYLGAVKVAFFMPVDEDKLLKNSFIFVDWNEKPVPYLIEEINWQNNEVAIVKLADVNDEKQAAGLQNRNFWVQEEMLSSDEPEEVGFEELIGYKVFDEENKALGEVTDIFEAGPQNLLEVTKGEKSFLVPIHEDLITAINRRKKQIIVELPEGLTEL